MAVVELRQDDRLAWSGRPPSSLVVYVGLIALTGFQMSRMPTGFIPEQDIGYLVTVIQLPPGSSLERTDAVVREVNDIILKTPGVEHTSPVTGFDVTTTTIAPNVGDDLLRPAFALRQAHPGRQCGDDAAESAQAAWPASRMPSSSWSIRRLSRAWALRAASS